MSTDKLTITLTGRRPVTVDKEAWPILARASVRPGSSRNGTPVPDSQTDLHKMIVRQHADGRTIVYAIVDAATSWTGTEDMRGGELLGSDAFIAKAIERVGEHCGILPSVIRDCIADLPAEEL